MRTYFFAGAKHLFTTNRPTSSPNLRPKFWLKRKWIPPQTRALSISSAIWLRELYLRVTPGRTGLVRVRFTLSPKNFLRTRMAVPA